MIYYRLNTSGVRAWMLSAISKITYSRFFPEELFTRGWIDRIDSRTERVWFWAVVISALSCSPNAYGEGASGSPSM